MSETKSDCVNGTVVAEREIPKQDSSFQRAVENQLQFRGLSGGMYKLVRVDERDSETTADASQETETGRTIRVDGGSVTGSSLDAKLRLTAEFTDTVNEFEARKTLRRLLSEEVRVTEAGLRPVSRNNSQTTDD